MKWIKGLPDIYDKISDIIDTIKKLNHTNII